MQNLYVQSTAKMLGLEKWAMGFGQGVTNVNDIPGSAPAKTKRKFHNVRGPGGRFMKRPVEEAAPATAPAAAPAADPNAAPAATEGFGAGVPGTAPDPNAAPAATEGFGAGVPGTGTGAVTEGPTAAGGAAAAGGGGGAGGYTPENLGGWDGVMQALKQYATTHNSQTQTINPAYKRLQEIYKGVQSGQYKTTPEVDAAVERITYFLNNAMQDEVQDAQTLKQLAPMIDGIAQKIKAPGGAGQGAGAAAPGGAAPGGAAGAAAEPEAGAAAGGTNMPGNLGSDKWNQTVNPQPGALGKAWNKVKNWAGNPLGRTPSPYANVASAKPRIMVTARMGSSEMLFK